MPRVLVLHTGYGCETGCCGHIIEVDGLQIGDFDFGHPNSNSTEDRMAYARELVTAQYGTEHVKDIDWVSSIILDD